MFNVYSLGFQKNMWKGKEIFMIWLGVSLPTLKKMVRISQKPRDRLDFARTAIKNTKLQNWKGVCKCNGIIN